MSTAIKIRGIYSTALTKLMLKGGITSLTLPAKSESFSDWNKPVQSMKS